MSTTDTTTTLSSNPKQCQKSPKQASVAQLNAKRAKTEYDNRYTAAFKAATNFIASKVKDEPVQTVCDRLNSGYRLDGKKRLARSTVYQAVKDGLAGSSPKARGPMPKIPDKFLEVVATHAVLCQAGDGELKGKDIKNLIGA